MLSKNSHPYHPIILKFLNVLPTLGLYDYVIQFIYLKSIAYHGTLNYIPKKITIYMGPTIFHCILLDTLFNDFKPLYKKLYNKKLAIFI